MYKNNILILLLLLFALIPCHAQKKKHNTEGMQESSFIEPVAVSEPIKEYISPNYIPPVPSKYVFFQLTNLENIDATVFFYCPEMESPDFSYKENLGSANNLSGDFSPFDEGKGYAKIPLKEFKDSELLIKATGYELLRVRIDNLSKDTTAITLKPIITEQTILINKDGFYDMSLEQNTPKYFYGKCRPIYFKDGGHADPACAFTCIGCDVYLDRKWQVKDVLNKSPEQVKKLYKKIKKTGSYSFLVTVNESKIKKFSVVDESSGKNEFEVLRQNLENMNWLIYPVTYTKNYIRLTFKAAQNN